MAVFLKEFPATVNGETLTVPKLRMSDFEALTEALREHHKTRIREKYLGDGFREGQLPELLLAADADRIAIGEVQAWAWTAPGCRAIWARLFVRMQRDPQTLSGFLDSDSPELLCSLAARATQTESDPKESPKGPTDAGTTPAPGA